MTKAIAIALIIYIVVIGLIVLVRRYNDRKRRTKYRVTSFGTLMDYNTACKFTEANILINAAETKDDADNLKLCISELHKDYGKTPDFKNIEALAWQKIFWIEAYA